MKTCPNCFRVNDDAAECCHECGAKFAVWKGAEPLPTPNHDNPKSGALFSALSSMSTMSLAFWVAIIHFAVSGMIGFITFASAWGSALSDSYVEPSPAPSALLILLEAPVALIQYIDVNIHPKTNSGLNFGWLLFLACGWSILFGWISAAFYKTFGAHKN